ncbi:MAG: two-component regulator propeller domain-containing protein, partial [Bacteroidota bacterium]
MKYLLLSWALIGMLAFAEAQQFQYRQYTTEEGLTHNQVFTIYEDTLGFMWFGTDDGLVRFDGQRFYDMRRVNSGFTGSFTLLQKAEGGGFWAGIYKKGLYKIMPGLQESYHEEFIEIPVGSDLIEEGDTLYSALAKSIYIRHSDSVHLLKFKGWFNRIFSDLGPSETRLSVLVNRLFITPQGKRRFLNGFGLFNFEDAQISGDGILVADSDLNKTILNCYEANDEYSYWLGGKGELYLYRDHQIAATLTHPAWKDKELHFIYKDSQENLWISVRDAGVFLKPLHGEIRFVGDEIGLKDEFANFIYEDRNQVLWFATTNNGVFRVEKNPYERVEIAQGAVKVNALGMSNAQELLVGANRQIYKFSSSGERLALLSSVMRGEVQSFHSRKGHTYASIFIESTDGRGDAAIEISPGLFAITASNTTFLNDSTLLMWFGGLTTKDNKLIGQLSVWDIDEQGALSIARSYRYPDKIPWRTFNTNGSLYNPDGSIWVALNKGLYYWDSIPDFEKEPVLPFESKDVIRLPDGRILFATINGLYVSDGKKDARLAAFFEGVSSSCMSFDQEQRLWVGSNEGLYVFEFNGEEILVKAQLGKGLNINCLLFEEDANTLWFGTDQGLYKLKTDAAELKASVIPQIQITELITEDSTYLFPQDVVIPSDNNYIRFQFSGLEFQNPRSLEIAYRLNGLSWQEIRSQELQLAALADGDYLLELKASNDGFNWSEIESVH